MTPTTGQKYRVWEVESPGGLFDFMLFKTSEEAIQYANERITAKIEQGDDVTVSVRQTIMTLEQINEAEGWGDEDGSGYEKINEEKQSS